MFCSNCGAQIPDNSSFCPNCGTGVPTVETQAPSEATQQPVYDQAQYEQQVYYDMPATKKPKKKLIAIISCALVIVIALSVAAFFIFGNSVTGDWDGKLDMGPMLTESLSSSSEIFKDFKGSLVLEFDLELRSDDTYRLTFDKEDVSEAFHEYAEELYLYVNSIPGYEQQAEQIRNKLNNVDFLSSLSSLPSSDKGTYTVEDDVIVLKSKDGEETYLKKDGRKLIATDEKGKPLEMAGENLVFTKD